MRKLNTNQLGDIGAFGEEVAVDYLEAAGYDIIERNAVCGGNEIDIIAIDMKYVVFVEVKTRTKYYGKSIKKSKIN